MFSNQPELFATDIPPWELDASGECRAAKVVFAEPPHGPFHYRIPEAFTAQVQPGVRVKVPLGRGNREMLAYCVAVETITQPPLALKPIEEVIDAEPLCTPRLLELFQWMSRYYVSPLGQVLDAAIPAGVRASAGSRLKTVLYATERARTSTDREQLSHKQRHVLQQLLAIEGGATREQLRQLAECSDGPIQALRQAGWIDSRQERVYDDGPPAAPLPKHPPLALSVDQRQALQQILESLDSGKQQTVLLHGVTGSGKTEVYMQAIHEVITYGRQAIVLVPEIGLTPQTKFRFVERFGQVAVLHSHMSAVERHHQWRKISSGQVPVVIGPRSAVFAPLPRLGLIVLDEEHEGSFKQDTLPRYHARDVALHRTYLEQIPLVLGSATPSLESWIRASRGAYRLASLPRRIHNRPLPVVTTIDLRSQQAVAGKGALSKPLQQAVRETLAAQGQVLLLLNRRGFATAIQCPQCGHVVACPDCDLPLTHHHDGDKACCHYCDYQIPSPPACPECKFTGIRLGGLGTQRLEAEAKYRFPQANVARMDSDTMRKPGSHERILNAFRDGQIQILLGTQMIAKGLDFPNVLLVGVINADTALHFPDFRASEKTFQLVTQVAGRTGRGDQAGQVLVQTYSPDHPAIQAASRHDFIGFANDELKKREQFGYPPYGYLARIIVRGADQSEAEGFTESLARRLEATRERLGIDCRILGPAPPPLYKLRGKFRFHVIMQTSQPEPLNRLIVRTIVELKPPGEVQFVVDIDPLDTL